MRKLTVLAVVAIMLALGALVGSHSVGAQEPDPIQPGPSDVPTFCSDAKYDLDGDGTLSNEDIYEWLTLVQACFDDNLKPTTDDCRGLIGDDAFNRADVDGNGRIEIADALEIYNRKEPCLPRLIKVRR